MSTDTKPPTLVGLLSGPDRPGIVADISSWVFKNGGNILHADQHHDHLDNIFFQRVEWASGNNDPSRCWTILRGLRSVTGRCKFG